MRPWIPVLFLLFVAGGCNRPTVEQCEQLCRDYAELSYWQKIDRSLEGEPSEERDRVRAEKEEEWEAKQEDDVFLRRLDNCVSDCRQNADQDMVACVGEAKTADEADACLDDD